MAEELINRQQIAELAGVSLQKVHAAAVIVRLRFPHPVGKKGHYYLYDQSAVADWLAENDLKKLPATSRTYAAHLGERHTRLNEANPRLDLLRANAFIRGVYAPECIKRLHQRRRRRAQRNQPETRVVHVKEADNARETPRPSLDLQAGPERQTVAQQSGDARQFC